MKFTILSPALAFMMWGSWNHCLGQGPIKKVYVAEFQAIRGVSPDLLTSFTNDFELILMEGRQFDVLERRSLDRLVAHARNEMRASTVRELASSTVDLLKRQGAQAVIFGEVDDDKESGEVVIYATLERFDSKKEWKRSVSFRRSLRDDRESRIAALRKLIPQPVAENPDVVAIHELRWKYQNAMNTMISTGDMTAIINLSVDKHNSISDAQRREMDELRRLVPMRLQQTQARAVFAIDEWRIQSIDNDQAAVAIQTTISGEEMGRPMEPKKQTGIVKLAKVKGEWLMATGGNVR